MNSHLEHINEELKSFLQFCKKNHLSDQEISYIIKPLTQALYRHKLKQKLFQLFIFAILSVIAYCILTTDLALWHLSAIGRLTLIKLLPIWNWKHLKNEKCLLPNYAVEQVTEFECALCEANKYINTEYDINPAYLDDRYIKLHKPIIINQGIKNWPIAKIELLQQPQFLKSTPCKLSTNIHNGITTIEVLLNKILNFDQYFLHFQNCNFEAMKAFRTLAPKPPSLPARLSPIQYSWLLISNNYNVTNYKLIELIDSITVIGQAKGYNYFQLIPRVNCEDFCPVMDFTLEEGQLLIFSSMYDLFYRPFPNSHNIAVILEMH